MPDPYIIQLLTRFFTGSLSIEEKETLADWVERQDEEELQQLVEKSWNEFEPGATIPKDKANDLLQAILSRAKASEKTKVISLQPRRTWRYVAVAASIIFALGIVSYFIINNKTTKPPQIVATVVSNDVKAPNASKAIITLANGQQLILDSAGNGTLAMQGNISVVKKEDGQLVYETSNNSSKSTEISYNTLTNPRGSKVINLTLSDGSKVWLNAESSLRYPTAFMGNERKVEITGEAYFEVAHNAVMPFKVKKDDAEITVLGTHFDVNAYNDEATLKVTLLEGSVKVSKGSISKMIKPGEQAIAITPSTGSGGQLTINNNVDIEEVMAWKNGKFNFHNADLETIMRQMARWYNVDVIYNDSIKDHYTVDVSRDVPVSQLFKFIEMSGGVHFEIDGKKIIVKR